MSRLNSFLIVIFLLFLLQACMTRGYYIIKKTESGIIKILFESFYDYKIKIKTGKNENIEYYQSYGMGIIAIGQSTRGRGTQIYTDAHINIVPTINFINLQTQLLFSKKHQSASDDLGRIYLVSARKLTIYKKGFKLEVNIQQENPEKIEFLYFELRDGMYYESLGDDNMEEVERIYDFSRFSISQKPFDDNDASWWYDISIIEGKQIKTILQGIQYFRAEENQLLLISPYGSYSFEYNSRNIYLIDNNITKDKYFYYFDGKKHNTLFFK
jgi:hypothetical protein